MNIEYNISSNGALLIVPITPPINSWTPNEFHPIPRSNRHPFQQMVQSLSQKPIRNIIRRNPTDTIMKSSSKPDMHITTLILEISSHMEYLYIMNFWSSA
jgi:hypothetical protein